jgi:sterol desaturase/sphingolipid hydroxylase (fatty acid hydroxylase superfamily)
MFDDVTIKPDGEKNYVEAREKDLGGIRLLIRHSIYATVLLPVSWALIIPFLPGHSFRPYAEGYGVIAVFLGAMNLAYLACCIFLIWDTWYYSTRKRKSRAD